MKNSSVVAEACQKLACKNYYYICDILAGVKLNVNMGCKPSPRVVLFICSLIIA